MRSGAFLGRAVLEMSLGTVLPAQMRSGASPGREILDFPDFQNFREILDFHEIPDVLDI